MKDFVWLKKGVIAGTSCPGRMGGMDEKTQKKDLEFLKKQGIKTLVCLIEHPFHLVRAERMGFDILHLPVPDFHPPSFNQFKVFLHLMKAQEALNRAVVIHCQAGLGRTGCLLAGYLVGQGLGVDEALKEVRSLKPGSVETKAQEEALEDLYQKLHRNELIS